MYYPPPFVYPSVASVFDIPLTDLLYYKWEHYTHPWHRGMRLAHAVYQNESPIAYSADKNYISNFTMQYHHTDVKEIGLAHTDKRHNRTWFYLLAAVCKECRIVYWGNFEQG